jgi:hypothetical protein
MIVYHEADPDMLNDILAYGLKRTSHGVLSKDKGITKTNKLLDRYRPRFLREAQVSRDNNTYAYLTTNSGIIDISTGNEISELEKATANHRKLLRIEVTAAHCYVSDLDAYDRLKVALESADDSSHINDLVKQYWDKIVRLDRYKMGQISRPEVMITYDVQPENITVVSAD